MKKTILFALVLLGGLHLSNAQEFRAGISGGLPIGDAGDLSSFALTVDLGYFIEISEGFKAGPITGYSHSFGEEIEIGGFTAEIDDAQFIPIGGGARYAVADALNIGADIGYALGLNEGNDGGFYLAPKLQYGVSETIDVVGAYRTVLLDGGSWDIISLGVEFGF